MNLQGNLDVADLCHVELVKDTDLFKGLEIQWLVTIDLNQKVLDEVLLGLFDFDGFEKTRFFEGLVREFLSQGDLFHSLKNGNLLFIKVKADNLLESQKLLSSETLRLAIN